jgi:hypothetical protein
MGGACSTYRGKEKCIWGFVWETWGKELNEDPCLDVMIILRWIFRKWDGRAWTGLIWFRIGKGGGYL